MRVLFVCSGNGQLVPFIKEQELSLQKIGVEIDYYRIAGKGAVGYLKNIRNLKYQIKEGGYDLVHAHYGLSGLLATFQRIVPVIVTYHGSDVNRISNRFFSLVASRLAQHNILVNKTMARQLFLNRRYSVIPCGIDFSIFSPVDKQNAREKLGLHPDKYYILFSSAFDNPVKNYPLAQAAVEKLEQAAELIELKNRNREEVNLLFNACNLLLMTSHTEGSPQVVKEALACNTPVVSTDVGDVKQIIQEMENSYITSYDPTDVAEKIQRVLQYDGECISRNTVEPYELQRVAHSVKDVYLNALKDKRIKKA